MTTLTPERIAAIRANIGAERPSWVLAGVITELLDALEAQQQEIARYRAALEKAWELTYPKTGDYWALRAGLQDLVSDTLHGKPVALRQEPSDAE